MEIGSDSKEYLFRMKEILNDLNEKDMVDSINNLIVTEKRKIDRLPTLTSKIKCYENLYDSITKLIVSIKKD